MNQTRTDNQISDAVPIGKPKRSPRLSSWLVAALLVVVLTTFVSYSYRIRQKVRLVMRVEEYGWTDSSSKLPRWIDNWADKLIGDNTWGFHRIYSFSSEEIGGAIPAELLSELSRTHRESIYDLSLADPQLTPQVARDLSQIESLCYLTIWFTGQSPETIPEEVLSELAKSKSLTGLYIGNSRLPPNTFNLLSNLESIQELGLRGSDVPLGELSALKNLTNLRSLSLWVEDVSDERLRDLDQLSGLTQLEIYSPNESDDLTVIDHLRKQLSGCTISVNQRASRLVEKQPPWDDAA